MNKNKWIIALIVIICAIIIGIAEYFINKPEIDINEDILRVYYFDVGQADCTIIINNGTIMLIDGANEADANSLVQYMQENLGIKKLDYVIATHDDQDHIAGLDKIVDKMEYVGTVYMPQTNKDSKEVQELENAVHNKGKNITVPKINQEFTVGKAKCVVKSIADATNVSSNKSSIVIEMTYGEKKFLFMGDYEELSDNEKKNYPEEYSKIGWDKVDVLKVSHHGSINGTTSGFLQAVSPDIAIISAGYNDKLNHPDAEVIDMLKEVNKDMKILITKDENIGTILIESDGITISEPQFKNLSLDGNR